MQAAQIDALFEVDSLEPIMETLLNKDDNPTDIEELKAKQTPMDPEKVKIIKEEIANLLKKGKSQRFVRRFIKRKYEITEY